MSIEIRYCKNKVKFKISEAANEKIRKWRASIDEEAYDYQICTGFISKGNKTVINSKLLDRIKQRTKKDGIKRPYEGASGGGMSYSFSITENGPVLKAYNYLTRKSLTIKRTPTPDYRKNMQKSIILFNLSGNEFKNLKAWKQIEQGNDCDYVYSFGPTSIGDSVKVKNRKTKSVIDLTDYDKW
jgi:hypothetical protein